MKLLKYRTIAVIYPFHSMEAMVQLDNGHTVYANVNANSNGEKLSVETCDGCRWIYTHSLTDMDLENHDISAYEYVNISNDEDKLVIEKLVALWNANPVFDNDYAWKDYEEADSIVHGDNSNKEPMKGFVEIASKSVNDADGFSTDYTMYLNTETGEYVFVFGDKDFYVPEDGDYDWSCNSETEAWEWFNSYAGFEEEEYIVRGKGRQQKGWR